jgi:hypothetical protein
MPRLQGRKGAAMYRKYGMPRLQGGISFPTNPKYLHPCRQRKGAAMYRQDFVPDES